MLAIAQLRRRLATPAIRRLLRRPDHLIIRRELAQRYIIGHGIEIGALNQPLHIPPNAHVRYVDCLSVDHINKKFSYFPSVQLPDIICTFETLSAIGDASQDFVIANHVLEHVENPLQAPCSTSRVLRKSGVAFIALPDKRYTFDRRRPITTIAHIVRDFTDGPEWSRHEHYVDWAKNVEKSRNIETRAAILESQQTNIHFHVWDYTAMIDFFCKATDIIGMTVVESRSNRAEAIWILRKP